MNKTPGFRLYTDSLDGDVYAITNGIAYSKSSDVTNDGFQYEVNADAPDTVRISLYSGKGSAVFEIPESIEGKTVTRVRLVLSSYLLEISPETIIFPDCVEEIECDVSYYDDVFRNVRTVVLPENLTAISRGTFRSFPNLENIIIPDGVTEIGDWAFNSCGIKSIVIPDSVEKIGSYAFANCKNLEDVRMSGGVKEIAEFAFAGCTSLKHITIPEHVARVGTGVFFDTGLSEAEILNRGVYLDEYSFAYTTDEEWEIDYGYEYYEVDIEDLDIYLKEDFTLCGDEDSGAECYAMQNECLFKNADTGSVTRFVNLSRQGEVQMPPEAHRYNEAYHVPEPIVTAGGRVLTKDIDYTVSYLNNKEEGEAQAIVRGTIDKSGEYTYVYPIRCSFRIFGSYYSGDNLCSCGGTQITPVDPDPDTDKNTDKEPVEPPDKNQRPSDEIVLSTTEFTLDMNGKPVMINAKSTAAITYVSLNTEIADVSPAGQITVKCPGMAKIKVSTLTDTKWVTVYVLPKQCKISSVKAGSKRKLTIKWKKDKYADSYCVQISTSKKFKKNVKTYTAKKASLTVKKLKAGKVYYVRVQSRTGSCIGKWSKVVKSKKVKK
ncbi:MAG: leucine-rich repeat protein [Ruminococcus flavefaciens]|nr:leucine-rich repeat protein [Ruminococcus flavefaciens]